MKIPNKRELQKIAFNHSSVIDFQDFMNLYKICTAKPFLLVIDTTIASDNYSRFSNNLLERIKKLIHLGNTSENLLNEIRYII